jgi:tRNA pseudouridine(38-40) synthase
MTKLFVVLTYIAVLIVNITNKKNDVSPFTVKVVPIHQKKCQSKVQNSRLDVGSASNEVMHTTTSPHEALITDCSRDENGQFKELRKDQPLTNALLLISYDGNRFTGWSSGNDNLTTTEINVEDNIQISVRKRRRARNFPKGSGFVRSVQGVLITNFAKLYGNVDRRRIVVEGSSRTDKGVHARAMVAQVYCITQDAWDTICSRKEAEETNLTDRELIELSMPGKRMPHPMNSTDTSYFVPLRMSLDKMTHAFNRMCVDVRIMAHASTPTTVKGTAPFHASKSSTSKTYLYTFSVGPMHDPTQRRSVWYVGRHEHWNETQFRQACRILEGTHDFSAFQGAPRGSDDKAKRSFQDTKCSVLSMTLNSTAVWKDTVTYTVSITGNRFLYKMVRFMVGACVAVGTGRIQLEELMHLIRNPSPHVQKFQRDINASSFECAPAHGLVLHDVKYDDSMTIDWFPANM